MRRPLVCGARRGDGVCSNARICSGVAQVLHGVDRGGLCGAAGRLVWQPDHDGGEPARLRCGELAVEPVCGSLRLLLLNLPST